MNTDNFSLSFLERVTFSLRQLYSGWGYKHFKMSKFEEYDLYAKNKDFLISDSVITFTDTSGKLMALKPDVTLSIIKNRKDNCDTISKVYYDENVYRVSKGTRTFKELMQVGLECIGKIGDYNIAEVLTLAVKSLKTISDDCVLDVSHLGILMDAVDSLHPADRNHTARTATPCPPDIPLRHIPACVSPRPQSALHKNGIR